MDEVLCQVGNDEQSIHYRARIQEKRHNSCLLWKPSFGFAFIEVIEPEIMNVYVQLISSLLLLRSAVAQGIIIFVALQVLFRYLRAFINNEGLFPRKNLGD